MEETRLERYARKMHEEIERHKWFKSQEMGRDVGWDYACIDWMINHEEQFRKDYLVIETGDSLRGGE